MIDTVTGATKEELKAAKQAEKKTAKAAKLAERQAAKEAAKAEKQPRQSMAKGWGEVFHQAATESKDQAWVEEEMIRRYPAKEATVRKWTTWYKNFYNMGKIKGFESPVKVEWPKHVSAETLAKREAKAQVKEQAKQEKLAAKEAAKAQKQAEKEAKKVTAAQ